MNRYMLVSADGHAGPPAHIYREYLDPEYRERFDEQHEKQAAIRAASPFGQGDKSEFQKEWELATDGDGGLAAAYDGTERNRLLDREGVVAEVLFPDADVLGTGRIASSPFGTGLAAGSQSEPELTVAGARATTDGSPTSARTTRFAASASRSYRRSSRTWTPSCAWCREAKELRPSRAS